MDKLLLDGQNLTIETVIQIAHGEPGDPPIALHDAARKRVTRAARAVGRLLETGQIAYGVTTGYGAFKGRLIGPG